MDTTTGAAGITGAQVNARRRSVRPIHVPRVTARDLEVLRWIARHGVVTPELVGRKFFWRPDRSSYGQWAAYRRLRSMRQLGLLVADRPIGFATDVLRVTDSGARVADVGLEPAALVLAELQHTLSVVWLGEYLHAQYPGSELITERELWAERYRRLAAGADTTDLGRVPDAVLRIPSTDSGAAGWRTVAIELDRSRKARAAMVTMVSRYDLVAVDAVWWYVKPVRVERVGALVSELGAADRFKVFPWHG